MATKDYFLSLKNNKHETFGFNVSSNGQYSNLNLNNNQNKQCFSENTVISTTNKVFTNEKLERIAAALLLECDSQKKRENLSMFLNPSNIYEQKFERKNYLKEFDYRKKNQNKNNSSTLSLHIKAYENSIENTFVPDLINGENSVIKKAKEEKEKGLIKKWKNTPNLFSNSAIKAAFELPRQQESDKIDNPEIMQFKTSQQLLNSSSNNQTPKSGILSWLRFRRKKSSLPSSSVSSSLPSRQMVGREPTITETTMDSTFINDQTEKRRKEYAEIRKMKAKKARRKPLPAQVQQKRKEKKKKQKKVSAPKKKDILIKDEEGRLFLRRRPIPDDPAYEGIVRTLLDEMPADTEQDILDGIYVRAVARELNWMEADEEQMMPRIEAINKQEYLKLKKERASEYSQLLKAFDKWSFALERFKSPEIADILVVKKNDDKQLPVPWIGVEEDPKSNSDEKKIRRERSKKKKHTKSKPKKSQIAEDLEEKSDDQNEKSKR